MSTEVWFRNPATWMPEVVAAGGSRVAWHRGTCIKRRIDPVAHARLFFPVGIDWRSLVVGVQGGVCYGPTSASTADPIAVYPVWHYGEKMDRLEELVDTPATELADLHDTDDLFRPRPGQDHRVIIVNWPSLRGGEHDPGRRFLTLLGEMQQDFPECRIHLFEAMSFRTAFGFGVGAVDLDVTFEAAHKHVFLGNGRRRHVDDVARAQQWVNLVGMSVSDLSDFRKRVEFNMRTALWAGENYGRNVKFRTSGWFGPDNPAEVVGVEGGQPTFTQDTFAAETQTAMSRRLAVQDGDRIACDSCSLADYCKFCRAGAVCSVPGSETVELAKFFKSRDAERIMDGLSAVLAAQSERAEMAMDSERQTGELQPETTKVLSAIFDGGVKLAKLRNPQLNGGPRIALQINNGAGHSSIVAANPKSLIAGVVKELEERGVPREHITPEVVMQMIEGAKPDYIDAEVVDAEPA